MRWRWPWIALAVAITALAPTTAAADYKESYKKGIEAAGRRDWPEVARHMKAAIAEQSAEGEQVKLYGMRFETYLPHYYLGLAYFSTGDCAGALAEWTVSTQQGAVKGAQRKTLSQNEAVCKTRLADEDSKKSATTALAQATAGAESELVKADQAARAAASLQSDPTLAAVWNQEPALADGQRQANDALSAARAKLEQARKSGNPGLAAEASALAAQASQRFGALTQAAQARRDELQRKAAAAPTAAPAPSASVAPGGIPADLLAGAQAYFDARYAEAADLLARANASGAGAAQVVLLRGAARFMLYVAGGQQDDGLRRAAADDVRACRRLNPRLSPSREAFSPRFVDFFQKNR